MSKFFDDTTQNDADLILDMYVCMNERSQDEADARERMSHDYASAVDADNQALVGFSADPDGEEDWMIETLDSDDALRCEIGSKMTLYFQKSNFEDRYELIGISPARNLSLHI